jgi:hypothetical protein
MALSYRKRGDVWHCRGTVRVGRRTFQLPEFSTGCRRKVDAEAIGAAEAARIQAEAFDGLAGQAPSRTVTVGECIIAYCARPGGLHRFDMARLLDLKAEMGDVPLAEVRAAWASWLRRRGRTSPRPPSRAVARP